MTWIKTIPAAEAEGRLRQLYDRIAGPGGAVDNILAAHSLRPHTLEGHMALYKNVLHHGSNRLPRWLLEALGVWVSVLNRCSYCVEHHHAGMRRLLDDETRAAAIRAALERGEPGAAFGPRERALFVYAERLTRAPGAMVEADVASVRAAGWDDGEILETNQVVAYFAYANRTVLGLGVCVDGDVLGLSPSSADGADWQHR